MLIRLAPLASMPPRATEGSTHHSRGQYGSAFGVLAFAGRQDATLLGEGQQAARAELTG